MVMDLDVAFTEWIYIGLLVAFLLADAVVLYLARNENEINNRYFRMHKTWGFAKTETVKLLAASFIVHELLSGTIKSGSWMGIIVVYCLIVLQFILEYGSFKRKSAKDRPPA